MWRCHRWQLLALSCHLWCVPRTRSGCPETDPQPLGALAKGTTDNRSHRSALAVQARRLIRRFTRYEDMILRFAVDLTVPFTNNCADRAVRSVKVQQLFTTGP